VSEKEAPNPAHADAAIGPLPPYVQLFDFMPDEEHRKLLAWVSANSALFRPATVYGGPAAGEGLIDPGQRIALATRKLGEIGQELRSLLMEAFHRIAEATGYRGPEPTSLELEIAAHGDGAHFAPHIDIPTGPDRRPLSGNPNDDRIISAVYYFHSLPKAFSGGELRLYRFGADPKGAGREPRNHVDIHPVDNSLVAFPSWVSHEVARVSCPGGEFSQYRFALNCWYCRPLGSKDR
jgi:SM-20-related protein